MSTASVLFMIWMILLLSSLHHVTEIEAKECLDTARRCGKMNIPFPFSVRGREAAGGLPGFEIDCKKNESFGTSECIPFLRTRKEDVQIINISVSDNYILVNSSSFIADACKGEFPALPFSKKSILLNRTGPFRISVKNTFVAVGFQSVGSFKMYSNDANDTVYSTGCASWGNGTSSISNCTGYGCCRRSVPANYTNIDVIVWSNMFSNFKINTTTRDCSDACAAIVDTDSCDTVSVSSVKNFTQTNIYMRLDWAIRYETCKLSEGKRNTSRHCHQNADCHTREWGIVCICRDGYKGNGYEKGTGCQDVNECSNSTMNNCTPWREGGQCENTVGSYKCFCRKGDGDGFKNGTSCASTSIQTIPIAIGMSVTLVAVLIGGAALFWIYRRKRILLTKRNNFHHNGGEHLQRLISSGAEDTKIFSLDEIKKATDNFSERSVLGTGGQGTVYKGTLANGLVVAIKKSKSLEVDPKETDQFINEIIVLSKINHRNVVKLLGCCLETSAPLLVYEYISNGSLFEHLYENKYQQDLKWEDRLRIATETAEALSYLHSAATIPIIHRDVKSSNILLDQKCTPKVADFGLSRLVLMDQTHITTRVQGTMGYLDPEYIQTVQLTEKSDVYSFGVVLVELLTGLKPVSYERTKDQSMLAIFFISIMKTQNLAEILDSRLMKDSGSVESMERVAKIAKECLRVEGEKRPTMKEVVQGLLLIRGETRAHSWSDGKAAANQEETVALVLDDVKRNDGDQPCTTSFSSGIEGLKTGR